MREVLTSLGAEVLADLPGTTPPKEGEKMVLFILNKDGSSDLCTKWDGGQPYWIGSGGDKYVEIDTIPEDERQDWQDKGWIFTRDCRVVER